MIIPTPQDAKHKNQMFRLLRALLRDNVLANILMFKGGTYASLRGVLDRFSVDLDFDLPDKTAKPAIRQKLYPLFKKLGLEVKDESTNHLQFFLKYAAGELERNTLKLEINDDVSPCNIYEKVRLMEVDVYCIGHTLPTAFANKMVAAIARYEKNGSIAGRDFYDMHTFFTKGIEVNRAVVEERTGISYSEYLKKLGDFVKMEVSERLLNEDLNMLMDRKQLRLMVPVLKEELLVYIRDASM